MSKRDAPSPLSRFSTKKTKSESKDVWGDDLDENLIEDCFIRASQVCNTDEVWFLYEYLMADLKTLTLLAKQWESFW